MEISELKTTASLAHLDLTEEELMQALPAFEEVLENFAAMQEADNDTAAFGGRLEDVALERPAVAAAWYRGDAALGSAQVVPGEELVHAAGDSDGPFFVVPNVL